MAIMVQDIEHAQDLGLGRISGLWRLNLGGFGRAGTELADEIETPLGAVAFASWAEADGAPPCRIGRLARSDPARKAPPSRANAPVVRCDISSSFQCKWVRPE